MKRKFILFVCILLILFLFVACSSESNFGMEADSGYELEEPSEAGEPFSLDRKIIYSANITLYADNFEDSISLIRASMDEGEWMDYESVNDTYARFTARIRSDRLDEYLAAISVGNTVNDYDKTATDISLNYADNEAQITSLEAERARLNELYETASTSDMIQINSRLSQIALEINRLQGLLNEYDSLVDYSEVFIRLYSKNSPEVSLPFGEKLNSVFISAWHALGALFKGILVALTAIFPFLVVLGPIAVGIYFLVKFLKKRKAEKAITNNNNNAKPNTNTTKPKKKNNIKPYNNNTTNPYNNNNINTTEPNDIKVDNSKEQDNPKNESAK